MKIVIFPLWIFLLYTNVQITSAGSNLRTSFDPFRLLTNQFLNTIQPNNGSLNLTLGWYFNASNGNSVNGDYRYYLDLYWQTYLGYIILLIIGILFFVFFPLVGMCFCCCRVCCKKCGAKSEAVYNMKKKRIAFNVCLFIFSSLILIGAIVAMGSNFIFLEVFQASNSTTDSEGNLIYAINTTVTKINSYIDNARKNISGPGLQAISQAFDSAPSSLSFIITKFIEIFKSVINFNFVTISVSNFTQTYSNLQTIAKNLSDISSQHNQQTDNFNSSLDNFKVNLRQLLTDDNCGNITICYTVRNQTELLTLGFNKSMINYTADGNANSIMNSYNISNLNNSTTSISNSLANVTNDANSTFTSYINSFLNNLNKTTLISQLNSTINSFMTTGINYVYDFQKSILNFQLGGGKNIAQGILYDYVQYGFYGFCALISIILLVVLLFYVGLCFGTCGGPNFEDSSACNKGKGGGFMMAAVAISFLFGWIIMLIIMIMFLLGGLSNTEVCRILTPSNTNQTLIVDSIINKFIPNISLGPVTLTNPKLYQYLTIECASSPNIISAFQISALNMASIVTFIQTSFIDSEINKTISQISKYNVSTIDTSEFDNNIVNISKVMNQLADTVSKATQNELSKSVLSPDFTNYATNVDQLIAQLKDNNKSDVASNIQSNITNFRINITNLDYMQSNYSKIKKLFDETVTALNFSLANMTLSFSVLKTQPSNARNLAVKGTEENLRIIVKTTLNRTVYDVINTLDCIGVSDSVKSAVNIFCITLLGPFNNIWMGIGWFLLFIIPAIIFAVKLTGIYRITHVESESAAYNHAYMSSNQFLNKNGLEMIRMGRPQKI